MLVSGTFFKIKHSNWESLSKGKKHWFFKHSYSESIKLKESNITTAENIWTQCAGHRDVVRSLVACGAHLQFGSLELGEELCSLARMGQKKMISCYKLAGADLNTGDFS